MNPETIKQLNDSVHFQEFKKYIALTILGLDSIDNIETKESDYIALQVLANKQAKDKLLDILRPFDVQTYKPVDNNEYAVDV